MKIEELPLDSIKPYEKNPRKNDGAVNGVAESIKQFGFQQPLVVDKNGVIVAGHTRYKAALKLGLKTVPCVRADQLTPKQVKAYRILDNKLNELATWDFAMLGEELSSFDFNFEGFDVSIPTLSINDFFDEQQGSTNDGALVSGSAPTQVASDGSPITANGSVVIGDGSGFSSIPGSDGENAPFRLLVELENEEDRAELLERLNDEGYSVRII